MRSLLLAALSLVPHAALVDAAAGAPQAPSPAASLLPLVFIFVIFYFLLIRPQKKRLAEHQAMVTAAKKGDHVVTSGGILGKVTAVENEETLRVEIASGVEVRVVRSTLTSIVDKDGKPIPPLPKQSGKNDNVTASSKPVANDN